MDYRDGSMPAIFELIEQINKRLKHMQRATISAADLTPPQYVALNLLWERDRRPLKELADGLHCTRATITGIVDTMEHKGLVRREPNPADRRSLLVVLTEAGQAMCDTVPALGTIFGNCCAGLSPEEALQLNHLLTKLKRSLEGDADA